MDFSKYVFRSHMVGKIIDVPKPLTVNQFKMLTDYRLRFHGEGRPLTDKQKIELTSLEHRYNQSKEFKLTDSTKILLSELAFAENHGRKVSINSPKLTKGNEVEKESRDLLSRVTGLFLTACNERKTNEWVTGAIDINPKKVIIDVKSSWSWESYSKILQDKPNEIYLRQGDSYMDLWNLKDFLLCHTLVDTPFNLIDNEIKREDWKSNILTMDGDVRDESIEIIKEIITDHIFSRKGLEEYCHQSSTIHLEWFDDFVEIPEESRVHMIPHSFDPVRIEQRNECIILAREHMNTCNPINYFNKNLIK